MFDELPHGKQPLVHRQGGQYPIQPSEDLILLPQQLQLLEGVLLALLQERKISFPTAHAITVPKILLSQGVQIAVIAESRLEQESMAP